MKNLKKYNVLFLEDNEVFAKNMMEFIGLFFNNVFLASTIEDALLLFDQKEIHFIISDIKVKDGNGLEFIEKVRKKDKIIPIIILSAHKDEDFLFKAIPLNLTDYILKPVEYDSVIGVLQKLEPKLEEIYKNIVFLNQEYYLDTKNRYIIKDKERIRLTEKESLLLLLLAKNRFFPTTKEMIEEFVYKEEIMSDSALKNLILRIRKKVNNDFITTVSNTGYKLK